MALATFTNDIIGLKSKSFFLYVTRYIPALQQKLWRQLGMSRRQWILKLTALPISHRSKTRLVEDKIFVEVQANHFSSPVRSDTKCSFGKDSFGGRNILSSITSLQERSCGITVILPTARREQASVFCERVEGWAIERFFCERVEGWAPFLRIVLTK